MAYENVSDELIKRLLDVMEHDIIPLTQEGVKEGNKVFGGAILKKNDFSLVISLKPIMSLKTLYGTAKCIH